MVFPLLEQVGKLSSPTVEPEPLIQLPASPKPDEVDEGSDWVVVPSSSYAGMYPVEFNFLILLSRHFSKTGNHFVFPEKVFKMSKI